MACENNLQCSAGWGGWKDRTISKHRKAHKHYRKTKKTFKPVYSLWKAAANLPKWQNVLWFDETQTEDFGTNTTRHITKRTPFPQWSMVAAEKCFGAIFSSAWTVAFFKVKGIINSTNISQLWQKTSEKNKNNSEHSKTLKQTNSRWASPKDAQSYRTAPNLNPTENLFLWPEDNRWPNLADSERFCREEWANVSKAKSSKKTKWCA